MHNKHEMALTFWCTRFRPLCCGAAEGPKARAVRFSVFPFVYFVFFVAAFAFQCLNRRTAETMDGH